MKEFIIFVLGSIFFMINVQADGPIILSEKSATVLIEWEKIKIQKIVDGKIYQSRLGLDNFDLKELVKPLSENERAEVLVCLMIRHRNLMTLGNETAQDFFAACAGTSYDKLDSRLLTKVNALAKEIFSKLDIDKLIEMEIIDQDHAKFISEILN